MVLRGILWHPIVLLTERERERERERAREREREREPLSREINPGTFSSPHARNFSTLYIPPLTTPFNSAWKRIESTVEIVQAVPLNSPVLLAFINIQRIRGSRGTNARRPLENLINVPRSKVARVRIRVHAPRSKFHSSSLRRLCYPTQPPADLQP